MHKLIFTAIPTVFFFLQQLLTFHERHGDFFPQWALPKFLFRCLIFGSYPQNGDCCQSPAVKKTMWRALVSQQKSIMSQSPPFTGSVVVSTVQHCSDIFLQVRLLFLLPKLLSSSIMCTEKTEMLAEKLIKLWTLPVQCC